MADTKISALTNVTTPTLADTYAISQTNSGTTTSFNITGTQVKALILTSPSATGTATMAALYVSGVTTCAAQLSASGTSTFAALYASAAGTFATSLNVAGTSTLGALQVTGISTFGASAHTVSGTATFAGGMIVSGPTGGTNISAYGPLAAGQVDMTPDRYLSTATFNASSTHPICTSVRFGHHVTCWVPAATGTGTNTAILPLSAAFMPGGAQIVPAYVEAGGTIAMGAVTISGAGTLGTFVMHPNSPTGTTTGTLTAGLPSGALLTWVT